MLAGIALSLKRWDWDYFLAKPRAVLGLWPTGRDVPSMKKFIQSTKPAK